MGADLQCLSLLLPLVPRKECGVFDDGTSPVVAASVANAEDSTSGQATGSAEHCGESEVAASQPVIAPLKEGSSLLQEPLLATSPQ